MTVYSDSFTRTAPLAGSSTDTGTGTWLGAGSTDGQNANVAGPAWLVAGTGDADLTAQATAGQYAGIFGRGLANGTGGWRLECYYQTFSSGYYDTRPNYIGQYRVGGIQVDSRDQSACPPMGSLSNVSQCGNSNFANSYTQSCGSYGSNVTYYLQGVYQSGTCQVYVPGSYTVYYSRLLNPNGAVAWSGQTAYAPTLRLRLQGAAITAWVNGTQVATAADNDAASRARTSVGIYSASGTASFTSFTVDTLNVPPNAPLVLEPANNAVVDRTQPVLLRWQFNDPDVSDTQSKYDLQYRPVGAETWTSRTAETPTTRYSAPANTFADGAQIEWQVRTYDGQGVVGPWSATSYFRAGTPPPPPTWTAPLNGGQIPTESYLAQWSSASQVSLQVQVFADDAGSPTGAALFDSGEVTSTRRELQLTFATNNVTRHLRVRVQAGGLWSTWASVRATVSYTPPAVTRVFVTADDKAGRIFVDLRDPDPTGTQPTVLFHELYRSDAAGSEERVAVALPLNGTWIDWTPASGVEQLYRAVAFGSNGVTSTSAPTA